MTAQRPRLEVSNLEIASSCAKISVAFMLLATVVIALLAAVGMFLFLILMIIMRTPALVFTISAIAGCGTIWLIVRQFNSRGARRRSVGTFRSP